MGRRLSAILLFLVFLYCTPLVECTTKKWIGPKDSLWTNSSCWSPSGVPTATDDVVITSNSSITIRLNSAVQVKSVSFGTVVGFGFVHVTQTLDLSGNGALAIAENMTIASRGVLSLSSSTISALNIINRGIIKGNGTLITNLYNTSPGQIVPGYDSYPCTLNVTGNFVQSGDAYLEILVRGNPTNISDPVKNDLLAVSGSATLGGYLVIFLDQRYNYQNRPLVIFKYGSVTGNWNKTVEKICVENCPSGVTYGGLQFNLDPNDVQISTSTTGDPGTDGGGGSPPSDCGNYGSSSYAVLLSTTVCECPTGWGGTDCSIAICPSDCNSRGDCISSQPTPYCDCQDGWRSSDCSVPDCPGTPDCNYHGNCISDTVPYCNCTSGWTDSACSTAVCPSNCSGHGTCYAGGVTPVCSCDANYTGADCSVLRVNCPSPCVHGSCNYTTGMCVCDKSWTGVACAVADCPGTPDCGNRGICVTNTTVKCVCDDFYTGTACENQLKCPGEPSCYGHGTCVWKNGTATCQCFSGWSGETCSVSDCPIVNGVVCNGHGNCYSQGSTPVCNCTPGWTGAYCNVTVVGCPGTPICSGHGDCVSGSCVCNSSYIGSLCDIPNCPGTPDCSLHGICVVDAVLGPICDCFSDYTGADCGTKLSCIDDCSGNHGSCITNTSTPYCQCTSDWTGSDCSVAVCRNNCSGNGICIAGNPPQCNCKAGYALEDCSLIIANCPSDCSNHGLCNQNGTCTCNSGWTGLSCEIADCPGTPDCLGHGACIVGNVTNYCQCSVAWSGDDCSIGKCENDCNGNGDCDVTSSSPSCICAPQFFGSDCKQSLASNKPGSSEPEKTGVFTVNSSLSFPVGYLAAIFVGVAIVAVVTVITVYQLRTNKYRRLLSSQLTGSGKSAEESAMY